MAEPLEPIRIGISSCLLGQKVRFDGGHKRDSFLTDTLGRYVEWVPVCPEVEVGMGTPRETVHLVRDLPRRRDRERVSPVRMVAPKSGADWTDRMVAYAQARVAKLATLDLSGYVLKKDSPSCGMERVKVHAPGAMPERTGTGLYAAALRARMPTLPDRGRGAAVRSAAARELRGAGVRVPPAPHAVRRRGGRVGQLVRFHTAHKLVLLAHAPAAYASLGRLVARAREKPRAELQAEYERTFMAALSRVATPARHANVLQHIAGYFRDRLDPTRAPSCWR